MSNTERFIRRTKERIGRAYGGVFIGAVDWSFNEHLQQKHQPYWCPHVHGVTATDDVKALKRGLKKQFPKTDLVRHPTKVEEWDGEDAWLRYCYERPSERRISNDEGTRYNKKTGEERTCRDTDKQPLRRKAQLELLLHLDEIGLAGRLVLRGVQFMTMDGIGPTFKDTAVKARMLENEGKED